MYSRVPRSVPAALVPAALLLCVPSAGGQAPDRTAGAEVAEGAPAAAAAPSALRASATPAHPFRLSVADATVTGSGMTVRIRFFWDDLQLAVMESTQNTEFRLAESEEVDATVAAYINGRLAVEAQDQRLSGVLVGRGVEDAARLDEVMWWYTLEYALPEATERVTIHNQVLFNVFEDQRNLVHLKTRSGKERTYYFGWDDDAVTVSLR